jgi:zinc transport system permease protein
MEILGLGFFQRALVAGMLTALVASLLSPYVVLRRMAFVGHGVAHAAFGGVALALLLGWNLTLAGLASGILMAFALGMMTRGEGVSEDSAIGILVAMGMAVGIVALSLRKTYTQDVFSFLFGSLLGVLPEDLPLIVGATTLVFVLLLVYGRSLYVATFNEELAQVEGLRVEFLRFLLMLLVALTVVVAMKIVGVVLVSALLVVPGVVGLRVGWGFGSATVVSVVAGQLAVVLGLLVSFWTGWPPGATIVLVLFALFVLSLFSSMVSFLGRRG